MSSERRLGLSAALAIWATLAFGGAFYGNWSGYGGRAFAVTLGVLALLVAGEILLAAGQVQERLAGVLGPHGALAPALLPLLAYLIYALGTNIFRWWRLGLAALLVLAPVLLVAWARNARPGAWQDYAAMFALWLPAKMHGLQHALWPYPQERLSHILTILLALNVATAAFLFQRRLDGVGYTIAWGRRWGLQAAVNFVLLAAIVIPLGQLIGFIRFEPHAAQLKALPFALLGNFLFTAWPEEFLFRGLLQNLLARTTGGADAGWLMASVIFGLAHITNGGFPNWRYVLLATIAGIFYGRTWRSTGSIFPAALVHMFVDVVWHLLFRTL